MCHHAPSDTGFDVWVEGEGADSWDKAANKAMTAAYKYALRQTFMIETGDDPDEEDSDTQRHKAMSESQSSGKKAPAGGNGNGNGKAPRRAPSNGSQKVSKFVTEVSRELANLCEFAGIDQDTLKAHLQAGALYPITDANGDDARAEARAYVHGLVKQQMVDVLKERNIDPNAFAEFLKANGVAADGKVTPDNMELAWDVLEDFLKEREVA